MAEAAPRSTSSLRELHQEVQLLADPQRARATASYFKTGPGQYGEGDVFVGLTLTQVRGLMRKYRDLGLEEAEELLRSPLHEERTLALLILSQRCRAKKTDDATRGKIYDLYLANTAYVNNWDLVDMSAEYIVGAYLADRPKGALMRLAASESVWERRIALLATSHYIKQGDASVALQVAEALLGDRHDLIHKATGWMLREVGKRCGRDYLRAFLDKHAATMPRTALRYALEHFDPAERQYYMEMKANASSRRTTGTHPQRG